MQYAQKTQKNITYAEDMVDKAKRTYTLLNAEKNITHKRYSGNHALDRERFDDIANWILDMMKRK